MSRIVIVGGHGKIAQHLIGILRDRGHEPVALVRDEAYRQELEALGAEVGLLDIEQQDVDGFARALQGADAVVFAAGGGADGNIERKRTVDLQGSVKSADGAARAGVSRFVQISALGVDDPLPASTDDTWRAYVEAKRDADAYLRESALEWTIVRPGRLVDDPGTGRVRLGPDVSDGEIPRADVATVIALALDEPGTIGQTWNLVGGDTPASDAVAAVAAS
ncbi:MAG: SDR family oxidoreductase [Nocardioides sp.]|nr:SDR family oxidoreductase [Nocardioides sp.]